jgi:hypothetical protein
MKKNDTNVKDAIVDIAKSLESVFKKYSKNTRTKAWEKLTSKDGEKQMKKILVDPNIPINTFQKLANQKNESFKNWLESKKNWNEDSSEMKNYMFFSNLKVIKDRAEKLLQMDPRELDAMIENGHDWASDHIATSKDDIEEVYNWVMGEENIENKDGFNEI